MSYKLSTVRVFVSDWERALEFYSRVLEMPVLFFDAELGWAELDTGEAHLALERADPRDDESAELVGRLLCVSLEVEDIEAKYASLVARGVAFLGPPEKQPWGGTLAHFKDPDANVITLLGR